MNKNRMDGIKNGYSSYIRFLISNIDWYDELKFRFEECEVDEAWIEINSRPFKGSIDIMVHGDIVVLTRI